MILCQIFFFGTEHKYSENDNYSQCTEKRKSPVLRVFIINELQILIDCKGKRKWVKQLKNNIYSNLVKTRGPATSAGKTPEGILKELNRQARKAPTTNYTNKDTKNKIVSPPYKGETGGF